MNLFRQDNYFRLFAGFEQHYLKEIRWKAQIFGL